MSDSFSDQHVKHMDSLSLLDTLCGKIRANAGLKNPARSVAEVQRYKDEIRKRLIECEVIKLENVTLRGRVSAGEAAVVEVERSRKTLKEAIEFAEEGWGYAGGYFKEKWNYAGQLAALKAALEEKE